MGGIPPARRPGTRGRISLRAKSDPNPPDNPQAPPADPPTPPSNPLANPPTPPDDDKTKRRDEIKGVLAELAASGEIFGGGGSENSEGPDLETAIGRVLERREAASKAREKAQERDQTLTDLKEKVDRGFGRIRRWFEPASPWGD